MALAVMIVPFLGTVVAVAIALRVGIGWLELGLWLPLHFLTFFGITGGFHRYLTHRSFKTSTPVRVGLVVLGSMAAQGPPLYWVATHRLHHALSDRTGDVHSPLGFSSRVKAFFFSHLWWMVVHPGGNISTHARDLLKDPLLFRLNNLYLYFLTAGFLLPAAIGYAVTGTAFGALLGFLWGGMVRAFTVNQLSWTIGSIAHMFGHQTYQTRDDSRNSFLLGLLTIGEGHHNNHHAFPSSAAHGLEWWEIDLTYYAIKALETLRLVHDVKVPTEATKNAARLRGFEATEIGMSGGE